MKRAFHSATLVASVVLSSCATFPRIVGTSIAGSKDEQRTITVQGLKQAVADAGAEGGSVHLFLVHGMSNHPFGKEADFKQKFGAEDYREILEKLRSKDYRDEPKRHNTFIKTIAETQFTPLVPRLAKRLNLEEDTDQSKLEWYLDGDGLLGYKLRRVFESAPNNGPKRRLVVHLSAWAPVSIAEKIELKANDDYDQRKTFIANKMIKDGVITWGLADAAQYVGKGKERIQLAVAKGVESMANEARLQSQSGRKESSDRFAFGAASLGSIITLDTLRCLADGNGNFCYIGSGKSGCISVSPETVKAMFSRSMPLYFFANQIPLLGPADPNSNKKDGIETKVASFAKDVGAKNLTVVAFNDPADFLGYRVPKIESNGSTKVDVVNVMTRNQSVGIWFVVNSPLDAHTGFSKTRAVMNYMADGGTVNSTGDTGILSWFFPTVEPKPNPDPSTPAANPMTPAPSRRGVLGQSAPTPSQPEQQSTT